MKRISKVNKIEQIQNDLRHKQNNSKEKQKNLDEFEGMLKEEERKLEEDKKETGKMKISSPLDIYKVEIQKQKPFRNIVNKTVEKSEENELDEK